VELTTLHAFRVLAETLHFGRAASQLGISQPTLSVRIRRLESQLGTPLLHRSTRRVALTEAGDTLFRETGRLFQTLDQALEATRRVAVGESGRITVAFASSVLFETLPALLRSFRERYPEVVLELRELATGPQLLALERGEVDVGFVREPPEDPRLSRETVRREPLVVALPRDHPLSAHDPEVEPFPLERLAHEPFVLFPASVAPGLHHQVLELCRRAGFAPRVVQESRELYTTVSLVEVGMGVTLVPASIRKMGWRGVTYHEVAGVETRIDMAWVAGPLRPVVERFLDHVRGALKLP
jgi:DNA-binding transcriptional LysR family regulator